MSKKIVDEIKAVVKGRKKKAKEPEVRLSGLTDIDELIFHQEEQRLSIKLLNERIDRIITAIHNSKPVKGL